MLGSSMRRYPYSNRIQRGHRVLNADVLNTLQIPPGSLPLDPISRSVLSVNPLQIKRSCFWALESTHDRPVLRTR